jgi:hypothetical protein
LYKWDASTGLVPLGAVAWARVGAPAISQDGNTVSFANITINTRPELGALQTPVIVTYKQGVEKMVFRNQLSGNGWVRNHLSPDGTFLLGGKMGASGQTANAARYNLNTGLVDVVPDPAGIDFVSYGGISLSGEHKLFLEGGEWSVGNYYQKGNGDMVPVPLWLVQGLSANGQFVLGEAACDSQGKAGICTAVWNTSSQEVQEVGYFRPTGMNQDASLIVGNGWSDIPGAKVWDAFNGVREFAAVLAQHGAESTGWSNFQGLTVSPDGNYIAGFGTNPYGERKPFVVRIIPECRGF